tara:strand:+ start:10691 stop:11050 length:360 start_codon:yes stop_codon:yes gene_type:complete
MGTITITYTGKKKPTPVVDQATEDSEIVTECSSTMEVSIVPIGTKYLEVVSNNGYSYTDAVDGNISAPVNVTMIIDAFQSFQSNQNTIASSITVRVRTTSGGTIEDSITMYRNHTPNIC